MRKLKIFIFIGAAFFTSGISAQSITLFKNDAETWAREQIIRGRLSNFFEPDIKNDFD